MTIPFIGILGFGEVGSRLADNLLQTCNSKIVLWDTQFANSASKATQRLKQFADKPRVSCAVDEESFAEQCDLIISAVTAEQCLFSALSVVPHCRPNTWFLDLNSVSPGTKQQVATVCSTQHVKFVEAAVMSPIDPKQIQSPIIIAGSYAREFEKIGQGLGFSNMTVCSDELGKASATKMCRSIMIKGMESLVTESMLSAHYYGVQQEVLSSLNNLIPHPDWPSHARYLISRSLEHGVRRAEEMREVAKTVSEAGLEPLMSSACAKRQDWTAQFVSALDKSELQDMLMAIRQQLQLLNNEETSC